MAKLEPLEEPIQQTKKVRRKDNGFSMFFIFVDYLFLLIFFGFLCFILFKMVGI